MEKRPSFRRDRRSIHLKRKPTTSQSSTTFSKQLPLPTTTTQPVTPSLTLPNGRSETSGGSDNQQIPAGSGNHRTVEDGIKLVTEISIQTAIHRSGWWNKRESKDDPVYSDRHMQDGSAAAIACVPVPLAIFFLICNVIIPGLGTILGGFSYCCIATTYDVYDRKSLSKKIPGLVCTNFMIGIAQFFTVPFIFVGWFWSLSWGVTMVCNALDRRANKIVRPLVEK